MLALTRNALSFDSFTAAIITNISKRQLYHPLCFIIPLVSGVANQYCYNNREYLVPSTNYTYSARCGKCQRLLGFMDGKAEIKCPRCKALNTVNPDNKIYTIEYNATVDMYAAIVGGSA